MKKFELTNESIEVNGVKLYRIKSLINFRDVKAGDLGGYVEKEDNLSHNGEAWVYDDAHVSDNAQVYGNAQVSGNARVYGNAKVFGDAAVFGYTCVYGNAQVYGDATVFGYVQVSSNAQVYGNTRVYDNAWVSGNALVSGNTWVNGYARVSGNAILLSDGDYICFKGFGYENRNTTMFKEKDSLIFVNCGCFSGTLSEFESRVKETHGNNKFAKEYLALVEAAKIHFEV